MKVAMVCPYDWSYPGGVRSHIAGLSKSLRKRGVEVEVIAPASEREDSIFSAGRSFPIPANGSIARLCFGPRPYRRVSDRLRERGFDLAHIHEPGSPSVSLLALIAARVPSVATFHASAERSLGYSLGKPLLERWFAKLQARVVVSEPARNLVSKYFPAEYELIPNGIDLTRFEGAAVDPELVQYKPFVLFVGRPEPRKGYEVALRAVEILRQTSDVRLVVVGSSPHGPDWVVPVGPVDDSRLPGVYAAADVYCAPSLRAESFGIVLAEAMATGTPVVCSDIAGYAEASGGAALLAPAGDAALFAERLSEALGGSAPRLIEGGRERAHELDWEVLVKRVLNTYERALS